MTLKILARHKKWVSGATITESVEREGTMRRFTATIRGWQNFLICECEGRKVNVQKIIDTVTNIRDRIDANDETVFYGQKGSGVTNK